MTVLTALLVYFGWQRNDVMTDRLGIEESILGQSTRDYLLRSVRPALVLLLVIAAGGLIWLQLDRVLAPRIRERGAADRVVRYSLRLLTWAWVLLPLVVFVFGTVSGAFVFTGGQEFAFIAWPLSIGAGALLTYYGMHLRGTVAPDKEPLLRIFVAITVVVMLFWGTSNYATLQGRTLADRLIGNMRGQNEVTVYSSKRLFLTGAGVAEAELPGKNNAYSYRYSGLRLLAHAGGRYFLVSDQWAPGKGAVMVLREKDSALRMEFSRS
ncbi:hypothetical protein ETD83_37530 [Actinomadura soli]|uniref:Uncharacterized protein n=1 Tax=Actinomadura soli TaxID=2508997 RepID=A0A5C4J0H7_9ACTN|nr:hypothetical protein [Actinomadura soli]TMQ89968.1 hypothetical protein ETD83_37530 [Actinomadura soli]